MEGVEKKDEYVQVVLWSYIDGVKDNFWSVPDVCSPSRPFGELLNSVRMVNDRRLRAIYDLEGTDVSAGFEEAPMSTFAKGCGIAHFRLYYTAAKHEWKHLRDAMRASLGNSN